MRRFLGPVGGTVLFLTAAVLVFGVLGWVTHAALTVERAQREAAAREELGSRLRVALWRLDGRMLPALGVEDSRPFYHYSPADPNLGYGLATTPLLVTTLPDWMKLHFQLDAATGWDSPQVLSPEVAERVRQAYPDLPLCNVGRERDGVLEEMRARFPAGSTLDVLAEHDLGLTRDNFVMPPTPVSSDAPSVQKQLQDTPGPKPDTWHIPPAVNSPNQPTPPVGNTSRKDAVSLFGMEVCTLPDPAPKPAGRGEIDESQKKGEIQNTIVPGPRPVPTQNSLQSNMGRGQQLEKGNEKNDRYATIQRGMSDVQPTPGTTAQARNPAQGGYSNFSNSMYQSNGSQTGNDTKAGANGTVLSPAFPGQPAPPGSMTTGSTAVAAATPAPSFGGPVPFAPAMPGAQPVPGVAGGGGAFKEAGTGAQPTNGNLKAGKPLTPELPVTPLAAKGPMAPKAENKQKAADAVEQDNDKRRMAAADGKAAPGSKGAVGDKDAASDKAGAGVAGEAAKIGQDVLAAKDQRGTNDQLHLAMRKRADEEGKPFFQRLADHVSDKERSNAMQDQVRKLRAAEERGLKPARETDRAVPPPGTNPPAPAQDNGGPANPFDANPTNPAAATPAPPIAVHLGSMRPKWVVGRDGSEVLVLARPVQMDNKMLCQGIVLDWPKLEAALKDEVKEFFPEAQLIPIKDPAAASPDRVMTALPVQLDPGPQPELPPAGLTTLRLGLLLAWAAAIIAFSAVGFCGWTLIDLAERRIRFVSAVTHELRTPLTSLRLYLDMLVSGMIQDEAKRQEYLNTLATESDRLHRLIDNVLDFARLEKRRTNSDVKPVSVISLVGQLRDTWTDRLAREERELVVISTLPDGQEVKTDAAMVQQIVGNLIDNARKYSRDAGDKRIWLWARPGGRTCVIIEVEDRGPGIPPNERRMIFKPFRRGGHADNTSGGAGLGLALAKSWAEVLGGKLTYRPADGGTGACFRLELPVG